MTTESWDKGTSLRWGLVLSVSLHLAFAALSLLDSIPDLSRFIPEPSMEVELVREPPPPPPPPPPAPAKEPPAPPPPKPEPAQTAPAKPIAPPQLQRAVIAEKSTAPKQPQHDTGISFERRNKPTPPAGELSQSAQDMVLAQVLRMWRFDVNSVRGSDLTISMTILVERDGSLSGEMNRNAPWNPGAVIRGYNTLPDGTVRRALESMLLALRMAQPLQLPPDDGKGWPRRMVISFRPGDL